MAYRTPDYGVSVSCLLLEPIAMQQIATLKAERIEFGFQRVPFGDPGMECWLLRNELVIARASLRPLVIRGCDFSHAHSLRIISRRAQRFDSTIGHEAPFFCSACWGSHVADRCRAAQQPSLR